MSKTDLSKIDVHCHYIPDFYRDALIANGHSRPDGIWGIPEWSEEGALAAMDKIGVAKAYLSISSPGVHFGDDTAARDLARQVNEEGARLARTHRDRFGFFASTPLPDIEGTLAEIAYAFDVLGASGVVFETNFDGMYLGNEHLEPVYAELDRRNAVLFLHPTSPAAPCTGHAPELPYPRPMLEFFFDTTRTVTDLVLSGVFERYPNIEVIVPHAGAALPILASRVDVIGARMAGKEGQDPMRNALRQLHFDLAGMPMPELLPALLSVADPSHLHYGSDLPFTPLPEVEAWAERLGSASVPGDGDIRKLLLANSEALLSRNR
ncbi:amidohydrolase family protein [Nocardia amikacinitolerans]|uniref:amidohydrolase family protein n=1 Tax=Nocardia amikacinitolerans TaxID=756689 RepID=UPI0020A5A999|nr:amidohydrolase family protein [Nocardia amikacinitolerans]MCP2281016.1 putative metal-dependent hydrolase, TIM-barrel fold [Nocardia amikacinitolerans]MCP2300039.1 putative metal-dependent hydrolase, TIM-barrel fold [Nocardia amikacinitolerans]